MSETVVDVVAATIGYWPGIDGILGSGLSRMLAYQQASEIVKALGLSPTLNADTVRRWGSGEVIHLGPASAVDRLTATEEAT